MRQAVAAADEGYIVTIGIEPTEPAVGFGYIHCGDAIEIADAPDARMVQSFVEKPDLATAERYVADDQHLWNGGMFIARADRLLDQMRDSEPALVAGLEELAAAWDDPATRGPAVDRIWPGLRKIAIDYSVAEPAAAAGRLVVIPGDFDWDDVGDFASIAKLQSGGRKSDLAILGENARVLADASSGHRHQPDRPHHLADRRAGHRRGRHPRRAAGDDEGERAAGEERRGRPEAERAFRRAL